MPRFLLAVLFLLILTGFVYAEGEEIFTIPHMAGCSEQTLPECQGMGGSHTAYPDPLSGNPAAIAIGEKFQFSMQFDSQIYDKELQLQGINSRGVIPIGDKFAIMLGTNSVNSKNFLIKGFQATTEEYDFVFGLGYQIDDHFSIGVSFAPKMDTTTSFSGSYPAMTPFGPMNFPLTGELTSKVKTGGRYGVLYHNSYNRGSFNLGGYWDIFQETTRMTTQIGIPGIFYQELTTEDLFITNRFRLGLYVENLFPKMDFALDYVSTSFRGNMSSYTFNNSKLQLGLNYHFSSLLSIQAGSNGHGFTAGISFSQKDFEISASYQNNPHYAEMGDNFGVGSSWSFSGFYRF